MSERRALGFSLCLVALSASCGGSSPPPPSAAEGSKPAPQGGASAASASGASGASDAKRAAGDKAGKGGGAAGKNVARDGDLITMVTPSMLLPDLAGERGVVALEDGHRRVLVDRMRLIAHEDGSLERAAELLPIGNVSAISIPTRLGGGYVFHATAGGGTQLWRSATWLGKLKPLVQLSQVASEVIPGFDRLYVRTTSNNRLAAIDPQTGESMSLAPLPPAAAYGVLAFADGWRAVVDTDLRGPLATFDAGTTWRPIGIRERVSAIPIVGGDPTIIVAGGQYRVDARGGVTYRSDASRESREAGAPRDEELPARPAGPFGKRPLRAAVEDGWPDSETTAVVARGGSLARVSLIDGAVVASVEGAYPERQSSCHAVRLGQGFGFICGERDGGTSIYAFAKPLAMKQVLRFKRPRFVASSGNGALVVRGVCSDDQAVLADTRAYCILGKDGKAREIRVKGEQLGFERVVALADGRVAVLVPPRAGSSGQLTILDGAAMSSVLLHLPAEPRGAQRELKRGMWLEGFEEREPGVLGGWVEAGGPIVGVRVALDGKVTAGEVRHDAGGAVFAGRFGLSVGEGGRAAESTDGGLTWELFDLPERDDDETSSGTRGCSPVGCAIKGWIRVGWGKLRSPDDLDPAPSPASLYAPLRVPATLAFDCDVVGAVTPPITAKAPAPAAPSPPTVRRRGDPTPLWLPFRNTPAPALQKDEVGLDNGAPYDVVSMRAYAWGRKGADWSRAGRWLVRFDDRFDPGGGVRASSASASPWSDEASAADAMGLTSYGLQWGAYLDPSGRSALAHACRGSGCALYSVSDGQPILPLRDPAGRTGSFFRPFPNGAVRVGETWFFVSQGPSYDSVAIWRSDLGVSRQLATFFRPTQARYSAPEPPRLVRRALGGGVGVLVSSAPEPGDRHGNYYVLPMNPDTGDLGEAIKLARKDLGGSVPDRCAPGQDGWLLDTTLESTPSLDLASGYASIDSVELRLRLDPGHACVEAMAARIDGTFTKSGATGPGPAPAPPTSAREVEAPSVPLSATERGSGRRWVFRCAKRGALTP
jgi:hypothetical protein